MLTPYFIRDQTDFQRISERKLDEHHEFAAEYYGHRREYRAHIDYRRTNGPLAELALAIEDERQQQRDAVDREIRIDADGAESTLEY